MHRFFVKPDQITNGTILIGGDDFRHITRVLRIKDSEPFEVCNACGQDFLCTIQTVGETELIAKIMAQHPSDGELPYQLSLFQGLPKGHKMDEIIQKGTEIGFFDFIPFVSKRSVAQIKDKKNKKTVRWQRIAYEAAKQSKRGIVPEIKEAINGVDEVVKKFEKYDLILLAYELEEKNDLKSVLHQFDNSPKKIALIIGPEGGFAQDEVKKICAYDGVECLSLGPRILRTETAGLVLAAQINFYYEK